MNGIIETDTNFVSEGMRRREGALPPHGQAELAKAGGRLVRLYDVWGKKDSADAWRNRLATHKP
jgi:hypothetical protein